MKNNLSYLLLSLSLSACRPDDQSLVMQAGEQFVGNYHVDISYGELCKYHFPLPMMSRRGVYDFIEAEIPAFSIDTKYFVSHVSYGPNSFIELYSSEFCNGVGSDSVARGIERRTGLAPSYAGLFTETENLGPLEESETSFPFLDREGMMEGRCTLKTRTDRGLDPYAVMELRYRYAIPLLLNHWSSEESEIYFSNDCDRKEMYFDDIQELTGINEIR